MHRLALLSAAALTLTAALPSWAQGQANMPMKSASMPMTSASMPHDCKDMMDQHAKGDAKAMPMKDMKEMPCMASGAASGASAPAPKKKTPAHDHPKFHKGQ